MKIEHYPADKLKKEILEIAGKHLDLKRYKIFFFGSRVKEENSDVSDIDIGIEGSEEIPVEAKLAIEEELDELPTMYKFDIVDFKKINPDFKKEALKNIELIN